MGYIDRQLDQVQALLNQGNPAAAHQLARGIALDEPQNARAQALLAEATQRLQNQPSPRVSPFTPLTTPPPPAKRRSPLAFILVTVLVLGGLAVFLLSATTGGSRATPGRSTFGGNPASASKVNVLYAVSGTARTASLTYQNANGGTEQKDVTLPWSESLSVPAGTFLYVSAQNGGKTGTIICTIRLGGQVFKTSTSEGAYKIASCSGAAR